jgi:hypothetical protein
MNKEFKRKVPEEIRKVRKDTKTTRFVIPAKAGIQINESEDDLINVMFFINAARGFNRGKEMKVL